MNIRRRAFLALMSSSLFLSTNCHWGDGTRNIGLDRSNRIEELVFSERNPPLKGIAVQRTLSLGDFGAKPNDEENDLPAFLRAIQELQRTNVSTELSIPKGRYVFMETEAGTAQLIQLDGIDDLVVKGNGSEIIIKNPDRGWINLTGCRNIVIQDLEIDYDPLPFSQGYVQKVDFGQASFDLLIEEGFPLMDTPQYRNLKPNLNWLGCSSWGMLKDPETPVRLKANCPFIFFAKRIERVSARLFRIFIQIPSNIQYFKPGDKYVHMARQDNAHLIVVEKSEQVTFQRLKIYSSPSFAFLSRYTSLFNVIDCTIEPRRGRWHSLDSDGVHTGGGRFGPWIENCRFEGIPDDGFIPAGSGGQLRILEKESEISLKMEPVHPFTVRVGDTIVFYNPRLGLPIAQSAVKDVDYEAGVVTFDRELPELQVRTYPAFNDRGYNMDTADRYFVFRNNTIKNSRRFPIRMSAPLPSYGVIERNLFEGLDASAIATFNDENWNVPHDLRKQIVEQALSEKASISGEDFDFGHIVIRKNTFREIGFSYANVLPEWGYSNTKANVNICLYKSGNLPSAYPVLKDYVLFENTFENWIGERAIEVFSGRDFVIQNNLFVNRDNRYKAEVPRSIIHVCNSRNFFIQGNEVIDDRKIPAFIVLDGQTDKIRVQDNSY